MRRRHSTSQRLACCRRGLPAIGNRWAVPVAHPPPMAMTAINIPKRRCTTNAIATDVPLILARFTCRRRPTCRGSTTAAAGSDTSRMMGSSFSRDVEQVEERRPGPASQLRVGQLADDLYTVATTVRRRSVWSAADAGYCQEYFAATPCCWLRQPEARQAGALQAEPPRRGGSAAGVSGIASQSSSSPACTWSQPAVNPT
jgi:hypothetical protein